MTPRLFFALWPDDGVRLHLARHCIELARDCAGRAVRPDALHMTLVFVGRIPKARVADLNGCAERVVARPFELSVDAAACFRRARVAWLGCNSMPGGLQDLQFALQAEVTQTGFDIDLRPFQPHITVVRNVRNPCEARALTPIEWPVSSFGLVESQSTKTGANYNLLKTWELRELK